MDEIEKELLKELGQKIKVARKKAKMNQTELAETTGIDRSYISMVEGWKVNVTFLKLKRIGNSLWITLKI